LISRGFSVRLIIWCLKSRSQGLRDVHHQPLSSGRVYMENVFYNDFQFLFGVPAMSVVQSVNHTALALKYEV
jgi:hypothetical protein